MSTVNKELIQQLELCKKKIASEGGKAVGFKLRSFNSAIKAIKTINEPISEAVQLKDIKGIGKGILSRVDEYCNNGIIEEIRDIPVETNTLNTTNELQQLLRITGVGEKKAEKLIKDGWNLEKLLQICKDSSKIQELLTKKVITHHQYLGIKYFHDLELRIPHDEITEISKLFDMWFPEFNSTSQYQILGSYRRNALTSGDMDVLVSIPTIKTDHDLEMASDTLPKLVHFLTKKGFLVDHLTKDGKSKYMGMCRLHNNPVRRIDIRLVPFESKGAAILYFTGSGEFNRIMRKWAIQLGYKLNEYGLWKRKGEGKITKQTEFDFSQNSYSEETIFQELGLDYLTPPQRHNVSSPEFIKYQREIDSRLKQQKN